MKKRLLTTSIVSLLFLVVTVQAQQIPAQVSPNRDLYITISEQVIFNLKYIYPLSAEQETKITKANNEYYQKRSVIENEKDHTVRSSRMNQLQQEHTRQLEGLFRDEQKAAYIKDRNNMAANISRQQVEKRSLNKNSYKEHADLETATMVERYALTLGQQSSVIRINNEYYLSLVTISESETELEARKTKRRKLQQEREVQLQALFSRNQYVAYRKDMDEMGLKVQQRKEQSEKAFEEQKAAAQKRMLDKQK